MNQHPLYITTEDYSRLRLLVNSVTTTKPGALEQLRQELERAVVVDPKAVPSNVVVMGSTVEIEDLATAEIETYTLVYPERADPDQNRLSILAPIGTALLGYGTGDEVNWKTPGGVRRLKIRRVTQPEPTPAPVGITLPIAFSPSA